MDTNRFHELLDSFSSKRITIFGDFILDEYLIGDTRRVSREAPVVVIDYRESVHHPGGGANAAQNVAVLDGSARAFGVIASNSATPNDVELFEALEVKQNAPRQTAELAARVIQRQGVALREKYPSPAGGEDGR